MQTITRWRIRVETLPGGVQSALYGARKLHPSGERLALSVFASQDAGDGFRLQVEDDRQLGMVRWHGASMPARRKRRVGWNPDF
jgi:hypothetical protein